MPMSSTLTIGVTILVRWLPVDHLNVSFYCLSRENITMSLYTSSYTVDSKQ